MERSVRLNGGMKSLRKRRAAKKPVRKAPDPPARATYPIDEAWKKTVRAAMKEQNISQARLAARVGAVPSAIVFVLNRATSSSLVPKIHEALGFEPPAATQAIRAA